MSLYTLAKFAYELGVNAPFGADTQERFSALHLSSHWLNPPRAFASDIIL